MWIFVKEITFRNTLFVSLLLLCEQFFVNLTFIFWIYSIGRLLTAAEIKLSSVKGTVVYMYNSTEHRQFIRCGHSCHGELGQDGPWMYKENWIQCWRQDPLLKLPNGAWSQTDYRERTSIWAHKACTFSLSPASNPQRHVQSLPSQINGERK